MKTNVSTFIESTDSSNIGFYNVNGHFVFKCGLKFFETLAIDADLFNAWSFLPQNVWYFSNCVCANSYDPVGNWRGQERQHDMFKLWTHIHRKQFQLFQVVSMTRGKSDSNDHKNYNITGEYWSCDQFSSSYTVGIDNRIDMYWASATAYGGNKAVCSCGRYELLILLLFSFTINNTKTR